jgi:Tol biopolymer transport system component
MNPKSNLLSLVCAVAFIASLLVSSGCAEKIPIVPKLSRIAFITQNDTRSREHVVVTMNEDGSGITELASWMHFIGQGDFQQCWSADRTRLIYIEGTREDPEKWLAVVDADGSNRHRVFNITDMNINGLSISPDGKTVLLAREEQRVIQIPHLGHIDLETKHPNNIYEVDVGSAEMKPLTDFLDIGAEAPVFSPDGKKIAFIGHTADPQTHDDVYVMNVDGSDIRRLMHHDGVMIRPGSVLQWSPDGKNILYDLITIMVDDTTDFDDLFTMDISSGKVVNLTNTDNVSEGEPYWSPDGKKIAFTAGSGWEWGVYVMDADGNNIKKVGDDLRQPSWLPDNRSIMAMRTMADRVYSLVIVDIDGQNMRTVIQSGDKYTYVADPVWLGE